MLTLREKMQLDIAWGYATNATWTVVVWTIYGYDVPWQWLWPMAMAMAMAIALPMLAFVA